VARLQRLLGPLQSATTTDHRAAKGPGASFKGLSFLRKRVMRQSPVRENRTPELVRGWSGDWLSYRDGA
jgi:hypothetical protein